ncbi:MAG: glycosyltransferase family 2 protein [Alphaproteobacteria bacterium]|nr:glycosyltransferase family 2 protein [Alphaproteobacteria bacterium]MCB9931346.1 glycosyltransferase family 2 protein [Alphaproteobacteria bacterium]
MPPFSIVIPAYNESENVGPLAREILSVLPADAVFEVIFIDDASTDGTADAVLAMRAEDPRVRLVRHRRNAGQSAAIRNGAKVALYDWVVTMDGDGQNDPADIPKLFALLEGAPAEPPLGLLGGLRLKRQDVFARRLVSRTANAIRQAVLQDNCRDTGCSLKAIRRELLIDLPNFRGLHRYLPALAPAYGYATRFVDVNHRARAAGVSKYTNWGRALVSLRDLLGVLWLRARAAAPFPYEADDS